VLHPVKEELRSAVDGLGLPGVVGIAVFQTAAGSLATPTRAAAAGELVKRRS